MADQQTVPAKAEEIGRLQDSPTILHALRHPEMVSRISAAIPRHMSPERMLRVMALSVQKTPKLAECHIMSLLGAMLACASLGLEPNTPLQHCFLIPFEKRKKEGNRWVTERVDVQLIIGYRGYLDLARRSGLVVNVHPDVVYEGDEFSYAFGSDQHLRHRPKGLRERPLYAYAHAKLTDGEAFEVLPYNLVLKIRNNSQGYRTALRAKERHEADGKKGDCLAYVTSPWVAYEHEMACKTMIRRLAKYMPMAIEFANAARLDEMSEIGRADLAKIAMADSSELMTMGPLAIAVGDEEPIDEELVETADKRTTPAEPTRQGPKPAEVKAETKVEPDKKIEPEKVVETKREPEPPRTETVTYDMITEDGDIEGAFADAGDWARHFMAAVKSAPTRLRGLRETNKDNIATVMAALDAGDDKAKAIGSDLRAVLIQDQTQPAAAEPAKSKTAAPITLVSVVKDGKTVVDWPLYYTHLKDALKACPTLADVDVLEAMEKPNLDRMAIGPRGAATVWFNQRRKDVGG